MYTGNMAEPTTTTVRLMDVDLARADALIPAVATDPTLRAAGVTVTRSLVLRLAVARGLDLLEAEARAASEDRDR